MGDGVEQIVDARAMDQIQLAQRVEGQALAVMMLCFVEQLDGRPLVQFGVDLAQMADHRRFVIVGGRHAAFRRLLHFGHVDHQHRVVRGHRAAAFGDDARRGQAMLPAGVGQRLHDVAGVLVQAVVDRAVAARTGAFVVDAQAAADVDMGDARAQLGQLDEVAGRLAHAVGDVADVGDLRAHVEMQQAQAILQAGVAQVFPQIQHLARRQAELGLVTTAVLPFARAQRGQAHAHAQARLDAQLARLLDDQRQLGGLFHHDEGLQAQLAADQGQPDVLAILVAVADDEAAGARQRQHRHQLGLAARFQAEALAGVRGQGAGHAAMLVDLDRVHRGVAATVIPVGLRLGEGGLQLAQAVAQDVREAHQQRQFGTVGAGGIHHLRQRDDRSAVALGRDHHAAGGVHVEIPFRPVRDGIGLAGLVGGPGHRRFQLNTNGRAFYRQWSWGFVTMRALAVPASPRWPRAHRPRPSRPPTTARSFPTQDRP